MRRSNRYSGPTHEGCFIQTSQDALILLQAVINNELPITEERPKERNRASLIRSGNVFIVDVRQGPIKRWTDGCAWSPSRILGQFLLYRERKDGRRPGSVVPSDAAAPKHSRRSSAALGHVSKFSRSSDSFASLFQPMKTNEMQLAASLELDQLNIKCAPAAVSASAASADGRRSSCSSTSSSGITIQDDLELTLLPNVLSELATHRPRTPESSYSLYGSLTSDNHYKRNGLLKKTMTVTYEESEYRIVCYYLPEDVEAKRLITPEQDERFSGIEVDPYLADIKNIKVPLVVNAHDIAALDPIYGTPISSSASSSSCDEHSPLSNSQDHSPQHCYHRAHDGSYQSNMSRKDPKHTASVSLGTHRTSFVLPTNSQWYQFDSPELAQGWTGLHSQNQWTQPQLHYSNIHHHRRQNNDGDLLRSSSGKSDDWVPQFSNYHDNTAFPASDIDLSFEEIGSKLPLTEIDGSRALFPRTGQFRGNSSSSLDPLVSFSPAAPARLATSDVSRGHHGHPRFDAAQQIGFSEEIGYQK